MKNLIMKSSTSHSKNNMGDEFYSLIKLVSGEEIFALVCVDESEDEPILILHNPIKMKQLNQLNQLSYIKVTLYDIADDATYKSRRNYTLNHLIERLKIYNYEKFNYEIINISLKK